MPDEKEIYAKFEALAQKLIYTPKEKIVKREKKGKLRKAKKKG